MNHPYDFNDINDYIEGRMSEADRLAFEKDLSQNQELQTALKAALAQEEIMRYLRTKALQQKMEAWMDEEDTSPERRLRIIPFSPWKMVAVAAAFALLVSAYFWWFAPKSDLDKVAETPQPQPADTLKTKPANPEPGIVLPENREKLAIQENNKKNNKKPESTTTPEEPSEPAYLAIAEERINPLERYFADTYRSIGNNNDTSRQTILKQLLVEKRYDEMAAEKQITTPEGIYLQAIALFRLHKFREAADKFDAIPEGNSLYYDAQWAKALALVPQLPGTCKELSALFDSIENTKYQQHKKKVAGIKTAIDFNTICPN